jgi:hypothetical protein
VHAPARPRSATARCLAPSPFIVLTGHIVHHVELQDLGGAKTLGRERGGPGYSTRSEKAPACHLQLLQRAARGLPIAKMTARVALIAGTEKWRFTSPIPPPITCMCVSSDSRESCLTWNLSVCTVRSDPTAILLLPLSLVLVAYIHIVTVASSGFSFSCRYNTVISIYRRPFDFERIVQSSIIDRLT